MTIYLVQHAESKSKEEDAARPLSETGVATVRRVAAFMKQSGAIAVGEIHHSTKLRARQTAEMLSELLGLKVPIKEVAHLEPLAEISHYVDLLETESDDLMLVGHLPYMNKLASHLVCGDERSQAFEFQQGGILRLERKEDIGDDSSAWSVHWMVVPSLLTTT